jgi:hypothetical protein
MKHPLKIILTVLLGLCSQISFCQDTAKSTFKITKIFATASGLKEGIINRKSLIDSEGIVIHGCPDCRVEGFEMWGKVQGYYPPQNPNMDTLARDPIDTLSILQYNKVLKSKSDLFTSAMKGYLLNPHGYWIVYFIELSNIQIMTPQGDKMVLNKIRLYLQ